jgi:hypothetical protein
MSEKKHFKRKRRFIDKKQQVRFAIEITVYSMIVPLVFLILAAAEHFSTWMMGGNVANIHPLLREILALFFHYWWGALLAIGAIAYVSVWFSHKIFGPIHRFELSLERKRSHPEERVSCRLRRKDYFREFSATLEDFINRPPNEDTAPIERENAEADESDLVSPDPA